MLLLFRVSSLRTDNANIKHAEFRYSYRICRVHVILLTETLFFFRGIPF